MPRPSYTSHDFGRRQQDYLGPALLQAGQRRWQQELPPPVLSELRYALLEGVPPELLHPLAEPRRRQGAIRRAIREWLEQHQVALLSQGGEALVNYLFGELAGFGPLQPFLADPEITEIKLIDPETLLIERAGRRLQRSVHFAGGVEQMRRLAVRLAELGGQQVSRRSPQAQVQLADGSRILLLPFEEIPQIFVRRRAPDPFGLDDLLAYGTVDQAVADYLRDLAGSLAFFLLAGPSGSGKTAFLEALLALFPPQAHLVVVQQGSEIRREGVHPLLTLLEGSDDPASPNSLEAVAMQTLKMGAISLVIGEIKGSEAAAILHGISAGVRGGGATIHTNDPEEALRRLARLARSSRFTDLFAGATAEELRQAVARSVHVVVQLEQSPRSGRRYVRQIAEVELAEQGWRLHPVFEGRLRPAAGGESVHWERLAESCPRIQSLLDNRPQSAGAATLEVERRDQLGRLMSSAAALARSGEWAGAQEQLQRVLEMAPGDAEARRLLQRVQGEWEGERQALSGQARELLQQADRAVQAAELANLERLQRQTAKAGLPQLAEQLEQRLWQARAAVLPLAEVMALALEHLGRDDRRAAALLRAILQRQPDHPEAGFYLELVD